MHTPLVDSHCHLNMIEHPDGTAAIIARARAAGVGQMLCVSVDLPSFPEVRALAEQHDDVAASVGVHPNSACAEEVSVARLVELADDNSIVAIGETGLDYFRSEGNLDWQRQRFRTHIQAAREINKPLIIHTREAKADVLRILQQEEARAVGGVMHCFVEDWETAAEAMAMNFMISFSGIVTFKNATRLHEVARAVPLENMLIETDSPYLAPVPHRGRQNEPAYLVHVAERIAELKEIAVENVIAATTQNYHTLFH